MKTIHYHSRSETGSLLIAVAVFMCCAMLFLWGVMFSASSQHKSVARAQVWNKAVPVMEAGVEEALTHLNKNCISNDINGLAVWNPTAEGWVVSGRNLSKTHATGNSCYLPDGSYFDVTISNYDAYLDTPTIYCTSSVALPLASFSSGAMFAAINTTVGGTSSRKVKVTTTTSRLFPYALTAKATMSFNGNGVTVDSYDSSDPNYSGANGAWSSSKTKWGGDIASNTNIVNAISLGNANIKGSIHHGTGASVGFGPNSFVGDASWVGHSGIQPGHETSDMNQYIPDVTVPELGAISSPLLGVDIGDVVTNTFTNTYVYPGTPLNLAAGDAIVATTTRRMTGQSTLPGTTNHYNETYVGRIATNSSSLPAVTNYVPSSVFTSTTIVLGLWHTNNSGPAAGTTYTNYSYTAGKNKNFDVYKWQDYTSTSSYTYDMFSSVDYSYVASWTISHSPTYTTNNSVHYDMVFDAPNHYSVSSTSGSILIRGSGTALIYVSGVTGASKVTIKDGASVKIYGAGDLTADNVNVGGKPVNFQFYGLPTCTSISYHGNFEFTGTIYAPEADFVLGGGGNDDPDIIGSVVCNTSSMGGHPHIHYDESLNKTGPQRSYMVGKWSEF